MGGMPPPPVSVATVAPARLPVTWEYVGQTIGSREVEVRARVAGIIQKRHYVEGATIRAGQLLFTLDSATFEAAVQRAEADVASSRAKVAQAQRNLERSKQLVAAKFVSQSQYDDALAVEQVAQADLKGAQARLAEAQLNLGFTRIAAPIGGVAGRALKSEGSYVSGSDILLTTISQVEPMHVLFGVPDAEQLRIRREADAGRLALPGNRRFEVQLVLADGSVYAHRGKLDFEGVRVSGNTGTSELRAEVPNPDGVLRPGTFVRVRLGGAFRDNAITVPQRAVLEGPQGKFVYVVGDDGKAQIRPVQVGEWTGENWLVTEGLNAGERVIVDGVMKVGPGAPVQVSAAGATAPAPDRKAAAEGKAPADGKAPAGAKAPADAKAAADAKAPVDAKAADAKAAVEAKK
jgi:membrane fusion protein (multidrug efflux system)